MGQFSNPVATHPRTNEVEVPPPRGCSKRKSRKSIGVEEQQIILNVAKYFQEESKSGNKPQFRAGAVIAKTAAATGRC